jgi:hypothetical protein
LDFPNYNCMTEHTIGFRGRFSRNMDKRKLTPN